MNDFNTLPGCLSYYGCPVKGLICITCEFIELCKKAAEGRGEML